MRAFQKTPDGGKDSTVEAFFILELKKYFSVALLRFNKGSRANYHSHAFNAYTWFLCGDLLEHVHGDRFWRSYKRSWKPKKTPRECMHKVFANRTSWCFTVRGPWSKTWQEVDTQTNELVTLTNGRVEIARKPNPKA